MSDQDGLFSDPNGEQLRLPGGAAQAGGTANTPDADHQAESPIHPLDIPQQFIPATSYEVRDELERIVRDDLLGPWEGETEQFRPGAAGPRERYLVGMLGPTRLPRSVAAAASELPDTEAGINDGGDGELPEVSTPQNLGRIWASSMGLSFAVPLDVDVLAVTASWGAYRPAEVEAEDGRKRRAWTREPARHQPEIRLDGGRTTRLVLAGTPEAGVLLAVDVRERAGHRIVELTLINAQPEPASQRDTAWLFQTALEVTAADGAAEVFLPIDDPLDDREGRDHDDVEELHLRLLYRNERRYAAGRNVAVHAERREDSRHAHRLATTWLPVHDVPATVAPVGAGTPLAEAMLAMDALAVAEPAELAAGLSPLVEGYAAWLDGRDAEAADPTLVPESLRPIAEHALHTARRAAERLRSGIALLADSASLGHDTALRAFRFANRAMALQRRNTTAAALREEHGLSAAQAADAVRDRGVAAASWRPFQLAFVLLNLPAITDPLHPERAADDTATVDLLFFPTGGGKTEAYLGLTAYTFAIRRLQGILGDGDQARSGAGGVAVLMRYTLRLLTAQQFQRAAALVCAAEVLRTEDETVWGRERFRIGLWVGSGVSPNWFEDADKQIGEARDNGDGRRTNVLQTLSCPWCGATLRPQRDLRSRAADRRVLLFCPEGEGPDACPFSERRCAEGLPIHTVDEEIYRYTPSLVIATVDKLAQLPWRGFAGLLFGRTTRWCPRHGFRHPDMDAKTQCADRHNAKGPLPAAATTVVGRLRPPDLIIQDELHLISGALGTTVGVFEAAVDELCTWQPALDRDTGPKIVASTATTKRARQQVLGVFGRRLEVFPPQVVDVADTFFSRQVPVTPQTPGRRYLGVCAHGTRFKSAEIRLAEILLIAAQTLLDRHGEAADPYLTLVGYFNATRELAGMRRYLDDDVATRVKRNGRLKGLSDRVLRNARLLTVQELTSRISSGDISEVLKRLELGFDPEIDTSSRHDAVGKDNKAAAKARDASRSGRKPGHPLAERAAERARQGRMPVDAVLATSMLQVGVDVSRFGLMVMTGQPKNTAEYIQASSRVGRSVDRPGLVVTLYNWSRPRDLAHFEDFEHYHATFYRQVEALSVTPYARRSLDRSTAAMYVAAVRHAVDAHSRNVDAHDVALGGEAVRRIDERLLRRAEAIGGERARDYLAERIRRLKDEWARHTTGAARLAYEEKKDRTQNLVGLLERPGNGRWTDRTVGMSMRETEHEINLLLPREDRLFRQSLEEPAWSFAPTQAGGEDPDDLDGADSGSGFATGAESAGRGGDR
ncbi:DISARM system helicase DrmA [Actinoalloteichus sp. GBA129-24]|uniref:DISARM system helicase DrmA n=1 Tax=Actinoalloteichus sp. GBA129-24 TaxID=1612551 RepID=UPI000950665E|nr:DISARM system helicase DrmA [Actinoalloteichus sp. GBA129-24]APU22203.1 helicase family protein [Actinoalloteichus sp. GBA129-24]